MAESMDPTRVTPATHKAVFENDRLRVLDIRMKPGQKAAMHSHPAYLVYSLTPGQVRFAFQDGTSEEVTLEPGMIVWREGETHAPENVGSDELHVLNIELKG